jgi:hypothetical protein
MKQSPFVYGTTVSLRSFTNREEEAAKLRHNLLNGVNTTIISPRRWGKSSLVEKVVASLAKEKKVRTVVIDLFSVSTEKEFLEIFAREVLKASGGKWQEWIKYAKEFFRQLVPKISMGFEERDFSLSFDWKDLAKHSQEVLDLPEEIGRKKGIQFIICLDEFQNLSNFREYESLEKKMRASWQRHKSVTYCLYGSKRHMMSEIFNSPAKPFYRFGDIMMLQRISSEKWQKFIVSSFSRTGKKISPELAAKIPMLMKRHSWYVQQLSHYLWSKTAKTADERLLKEAAMELIQANTPLYQKEIEDLSGTQVSLLKAIAKKEQKLTSVTVMESYALGTPRNVAKNRDVLIARDIINEENNELHFLDPAFEMWFRKQFLNENYF